jgi:Uma2 family endonuclease
MTSTAIFGSLDLLSREMRRLHLPEYHRMLEAGVFDEDERVELLEGVIVSMSPQNADRALAVERLSDPLFVGLPADFVIRCQLPLALSEADEPEPDVAVLERTTPRSRQAQPTTARLVFEVSSDSLRRVREIKAPLYAHAGIPEYVIVNLKDERLEVHRDPDLSTGRYRTLTTLDKSATFSSSSVAGLRFSIARLLE